MTVSETVRRALTRDDLFMFAYEAHVAVGVITSQAQRNRPESTQPEILTEEGLYSMAAREHLAAASVPRSYAPAKHRAWAATILRFARMVHLTLDADIADVDDVALLREALATMAAAGGDLYRDPTLGIIIHHWTARGLRVAGRYDEARELAERPQEFFHGSGALPLYAEFQFELGASLILDGQASQVRPALEEADAFWDRPEHVAKPTGYRYQLIRMLAASETGDLDQAAARLDEALARLANGERLSVTLERERRELQRMCLLLNRAELRSAIGDSTGAVADGFAALHAADEVRTRWAVISRSRGPLATAFRRLYGDIGLLAAHLGSGPAAEGAAAEAAAQAAAELGLTAAIAAKRTGFASLMRSGRTLTSPRLRVMIDDIIRQEEALASDTGGDERELRSLRRELEDEYSALLADTVLPQPRPVAEVAGLVGDRVALDFVALPHSLSGPYDRTWFRGLLRPDGPPEFDLVTPGPAFDGYFFGDDAWYWRLDTARPGYGPDWRALAAEILPAALRRRLTEATVDDPVELVVSPHSELCHFPWPALRLDDGTRLLDRAIVTQTPVLTVLSGQPLPVATGPAVIQLMDDDGSLNVERERQAWGLPEEAVGLVVRHDADTEHTALDAAVAAVASSLAAALTARPTPWRFAHVAAHGDGEGLGQCLYLSEPISAGHALGLAWPESVLMASCHLGRLQNLDEAEIFGYLIAVLAGGSRCVVAGLDRVPDRATGKIAADIVRQVRAGGVRLDVALRRAQREIEPSGREFDWALLNAFVR